MAWWLNAWKIVGECVSANRPSLPPSTANSTVQIPTLKPIARTHNPTMVVAPPTLKPMLPTSKPTDFVMPPTSKPTSQTNKPTLLAAPPTPKPHLQTNKPTNFVSPPSSKPMFPTKKPTASTAIQTSKPVSSTIKPTVSAVPPTPMPLLPTNKPTLSPVKQIAHPAPPKLTPIPTVLETQSPSYAPTESPTYATSTFAPTSYNDPISPPCSTSQTRIRIELLTDGFPSDTSWAFKRKGEEEGRNGALLLRSKKYDQVSQSDVRELCLDRGTYEFIIQDIFSDGLCCDHGNGYYKISALSSDDEWQLVLAGAEFITEEINHTFAVLENGQFELVCEHPKRKITIEIQTDNFGEDTSWQFRDHSGTVIAKNEHKYGWKEQDSRDLCVEDKCKNSLLFFDRKYS